MLAVLLIMGGLVSLIHAQDFPLSVLSSEDAVITGRFFDSLLLSLPPCTYAGKNVDLEYQDYNNNKSYILTNIFMVSSCVYIGDMQGSTAVSRNIGYQLMNLSNGTQYKINYKIGVNKSTSVIVYTRTAAVNYRDVDLGFTGRSAAMVVITSILSVAMFVLLIGIIIVLLSPSEE
ncbi:uroplakin 2-like isoform X1 [Silurus asotus]|uniref:Uroplakin 2-like isoform X1 n=1 Tax=Silurus asotus TaxID=30991 RepID=A0AAD5A354_SILAS|nr:uroplakin 2-like isoform X1 [Silurus asotus]